MSESDIWALLVDRDRVIRGYINSYGTVVRIEEPTTRKQQEWMWLPKFMDHCPHLIEIDRPIPFRITSIHITPEQWKWIWGESGARENFLKRPWNQSVCPQGMQWDLATGQCVLGLSRGEIKESFPSGIPLPTSLSAPAAIYVSPAPMRPAPTPFYSPPIPVSVPMPVPGPTPAPAPAPAPSSEFYDIPEAPPEPDMPETSDVPEAPPPPADVASVVRFSRSAPKPATRPLSQAPRTVTAADLKAITLRKPSAPAFPPPPRESKAPPGVPTVSALQAFKFKKVSERKAPTVFESALSPQQRLLQQASQRMDPALARIVARRQVVDPEDKDFAGGGGGGDQSEARTTLSHIRQLENETASRWEPVYEHRGGKSEAFVDACGTMNQMRRLSSGWRVGLGARLCEQDESSSRYLMVGIPYEVTSDTRWMDPFVISKHSCELGMLWGLCFPSTELMSLADMISAGVIDESAFRHLNAWIRNAHEQGRIIGDFDPSILFYAAGESQVKCRFCMHERGGLSRWILLSPYTEPTTFRYLPQSTSLSERQHWDWTYVKHLLQGIRLRTNGKIIAQFVSFHHGATYGNIRQ